MSLLPGVQAVITDARDHWRQLPAVIAERRRQQRNAYMRAYMRTARQRSHALSIALTDEQYRRLAQEARALGRKPTTCFREAAFAYFDRRILLPAAYTAAVTAALGEIRRVGNNVNQLAHQANTRGRATHREVQEARRLLAGLETAVARCLRPLSLPDAPLADPPPPAGGRAA